MLSCAASGVCVAFLPPSALSEIGFVSLCVGSGAVLPFAEFSHRWAWLHVSLCGRGTLAGRKERPSSCLLARLLPSYQISSQLHDAGRHAESWSSRVL